MTEAASSYNPAAETFPAYLRRQAEDAERKAPSFAGTSYPPEWWIASAAADRKLADDIEAISQVAS